MKTHTSLRQFVIVFVGTAAAVFVIRYTQLFEHLSYSIEKGRLRALSEHRPSEALLGTLQTPNRIVAQLVTPAVVHIETTRTVGYRDAAAISRLLDENPGFESSHPWLQDRENGLGDEGPFPIIESGLGSGFVYDAENGYIVTNYHVTQDADRIKVILPDGRRYDATVVGTDPTTDLAVLSVPADRLHEIRFGDSRSLSVGDDVFSLGNPFGLDGTFSRGIVSGLGRNDVAIGNVKYQGFIQTDAVINPGNSGGPLVNLRGEVVGVNTAIATNTGTFNGVGFAIPSRRVVQLLPQLVRGGTVVRGFLGVSITDVRRDRERAMRLGWEKPEGVFVSPMNEQSPAALAGMKAGDILVEINDHPVSTSVDLMDTIAALPPGSVVTLRYWRDGAFETAEVKLIKRPDGV